jgi:hypothetical protein
VWLIFLGLVSGSVIHGVNVCSETEVQGPYGAQFSGITWIAGTPKPAVGLARLVFNPDKTISGYSSVSFDGMLLGNPVTGTYEIKSDCTMTWSLQDDSGAFQHFSGTVTPGRNKVEFRQTDRNTGQRGIMEKTSDACTAQDLKPRYAFTMAAAKGILDVSADGSFTIGIAMVEGAPIDVPASGTFTVDPDCIVHITFGDVETNLRGILVNRGAEILAIQIGPGKTVSARFTAQ